MIYDAVFVLRTTLAPNGKVVYLGRRRLHENIISREPLLIKLQRDVSLFWIHPCRNGISAGNDSITCAFLALQAYRNWVTLHE